ncbi:Carboxy-terminal processing protease CtpB precursor [Mariniblastus fucicola]|uniref:Carboxy-terminal processing protease CtpB n=2 Tax=Mariniblastus fucicola TaxID=980251 RepID=A0A5B9PHR3_9BACT|nr:Carboxy-terminal processing protease CtpB precursor [Mariniblastus fucicola]
MLAWQFVCFWTTIHLSIPLFSSIDLPAMPLRNLLIIAITIAVALVCYRTAAKNRYANLFAEAMDVVDAKSLTVVPREQLFDAAMNGMFGKLDRYSRYISGEMFRDFDEAISQKFGGLGIYVERHVQDNSLVILAAIPGGPASQSGLRSGDRIVEIDGEPTLDLDRKQGVELLRGDVGEVAKLRIQREGEFLDVDVARRVIAVESVVGDSRDDQGNWVFRLESNPRIGYMRLRQFGERTAEEVETALEQINGKVDSVIIDLRHNSGGLLTSAISICDMFLEPGKEIVSTQGRNRMRQSEHASSEKLSIDQNVPVVILINRYSASASEIVAGCLQDHGRATLIGEQSWGKGTVQNIIPVRPNVSVMKLTTASYWRPSGKPIDRSTSGAEESGIWGVRPEPAFAVPMEESDVWRNFQKRNLRDIETLIPPEQQNDLLPILLERPLLVVEPRDAGSEDPVTPVEDVEEKASSLLEWSDEVLDRAIDFLEPVAHRAAA